VPGGAQVPVQTVLGEIASGELGVTLMHEHLLIDIGALFHAPPKQDVQRTEAAESAMAPRFTALLRDDPFGSRDNLVLGDVPVAIEEVRVFADAGGSTIVDPTGEDMGRNPRALQEISRAAGVNVVMGCGHYLSALHPQALESATDDDLEEEIVADIREGVDGTGIRAGIIGEIGVSRAFTRSEERVLRAAARAQAVTGVPLLIHLPGWKRYGPRVIDIVEEEGGSAAGTVLCHMNPSHLDRPYQRGLVERSAWIEYDMIGMDWYYADADEQCPSDEELARSVAALIADGCLERLLFSSDVFLKMMLTRFGGNGYAHVLRSFLPRLKRHGVREDMLDTLVRANPRAVFEAARGLVP
jgi:phosphotriesterase-related protein